MLIKYAHARILGVDTDFVGLTKVAHRHNFQYQPRKGFVYIRSRAISSRTNDNFDTFPAEELRKAWHTFIGKPVFVNHHNEDPTRMRGVIIDAALHEDKAPDGTDDTWVEVLMEIDAKRFPKLAMALIKQEIERTSMGTDVLVSTCSYCGNEARTPDKYCAHVKRMKGQRLRRKNEVTGEIEDVLVHEVCSGLSFFENSLLVEEPADPTAYAYGLDVRGILEEEEFQDKLAKVASFKPTAADGPSHAPSGGQPLNRGNRDFEIRKKGKDYEVYDRATGEQLGVVWRGRNVWYGQAMDGTYVVDGYTGSLQVACSNVAQYRGGTVARKTAAVELDELQRGRFKGTSVDKDADGFYCKTHRCRSDSYPTIDDIPDTAIKFIESTGAKTAMNESCSGTGAVAELRVEQGNTSWVRGLDGRVERAGVVSCPVCGMDQDVRVSADQVQSGLVAVPEHWDLRSTGAKMKTAVQHTAPGGGVHAPYNVEQRDGKWVVVNDLGEVKGTHDSKDEAREQQKALYANVPGASEMAERKSSALTGAIDLGVPTEVRVPPEVETLRAPQCPVCDSDAAWNSDGRCGVCGYLPPPKPFRAPDTDVAGRADQSGGWFDPELTRASPFKLDPAMSVKTAEASCETCGGSGVYRKNGIPHACLDCPKGRAILERLRSQGAKSPVQSPVPKPKGQRPDQGVPMAQSVASVARQRIVADRALASENAQLREQIAQLTGKKTADIDNPAQPVREPASEAATPVTQPDATIDVETVGGVVAPPDLSVPGDVTTPGQELPVTEADSKDVEAPVSGGSDVEDSTTEVKPNADADGITPNAFGGDWANPGAGTIGPTGSVASQRATAGRVQGQIRDRIWASVHLARLRIQSGIAETGDDLSLGREIEKSAVSIEAIQAEASGLAAALRARPAQHRQASRTPTRSPSLAAGSQPQIIGLASRTDDEALFE